MASEPRAQRRAVLVPTMNRLDDMMEMVDSVLAQSIPVHVFAVVDAGDTPTLEARLREKLQPAGIELFFTFYLLPLPVPRSMIYKSHIYIYIYRERERNM